MRIALFGATGFVGSAVARACVAADHEVVALRSPRVRCEASDVDQVQDQAQSLNELVDSTAAQILGCDVVVNAAGCAEALSGDEAVLLGANALLPAVLAAAVGVAAVPRLVQVSSAAVQGRRPILDESAEYDAFSPYARSKILGEQAVRRTAAGVVYRPTSVHGLSRGVTEKLAGIARGPISSVAGDGSRPTPQILDTSVGSAVRFIVEADRVPGIVMHPWESMTTRSLLVALGAGRTPRRIPASVARGTVRTLSRAAQLRPGAQGLARRLEMLWFGQEQGDSWLTSTGWTGAATPEDWSALGRELAARRQSVVQSVAQ